MLGKILAQDASVHFHSYPFDHEVGEKASVILCETVPFLLRSSTGMFSSSGVSM